MKRLVFLAIVTITLSCSPVNRAFSEPGEDMLYVTRQYIGNFEDYRHTAPARFGDPHLIWIKTTQDGTYGNISAYSRDCKFHTGDRLYLRRTYVIPGIFGYWMYQIENDSFIFYKLSEYQNDKKVLVQSWY
jgi:hypothetical protein